LTVFDELQRDWEAGVVTASVERFERRLVEAAASLRVEMAHGVAELKDDMAAHRFELLKWMFVFWVGQTFTTAMLMAAMLQIVKT
jgi:hypothetical protein